MELEKLTATDIEAMDYNELIAITKETNRIPGGRRTVFEIASRTCLDRHDRVLEIGTSTGFTAIELSKLVPCELTSIDINETSLEEAESRAKQEGFSNITFRKADVNALPFEDDSFDVVIVGNVLSLMGDKEQAFAECRRVCTKSGFIVAVPMFYVEAPSDELVRNVSEAIQVDITPLYTQDWEEFFDVPGLEVYYSADYRFDRMEDATIEEFVDTILAREHLRVMQPEAFTVLKRDYRDSMMLFRDNLAQMGFRVTILSNQMLWEDPELYTSRRMQ